MYNSGFKVYCSSICLGFFLLFSILPATLIMFNADNQIKVAFTITEEERKSNLDEESKLDFSLAYASIDPQNDNGLRSRIDRDDERWILQSIYYNVISPPPELI